jgi:hypothetical protein
VTNTYSQINPSFIHPVEESEECRLEKRISASTAPSKISESEENEMNERQFKTGLARSESLSQRERFPNVIYRKQ